MRTIIALIRPRHWIKNLLVFAPLIFARDYRESAFLYSLYAFAAFSLVASGIYVINDLFDRASDRLHPVKKLRPIASGAIRPGIAWVIGCTLIAAGLIVALLSHCLALLLGYFVLNLLYSAHLKRMLILDVMIIAVGFVMRVLVGSAAIQVSVSHWIILCTFFASLFLGFGKRKNEVHVMQAGSRDHRKVLEHYTESFLNQLLGISAALSILSYALYTIDPETVGRLGTDRLLYTTPFVAYGIFHYFHLLYNHDSGGDPTKIFVKDPPMILTMLGWLLAVVLLTA